VSGVSEYAKQVALTLADDNEVTVLTIRNDVSQTTEEIMDGFKVVRAKPDFFINKGYLSRDFIKKFIRLASHSDVVNLHLPMLESGLFVKLTKKPILVTYQCDMAYVGNLMSRLAVLAVKFSMNAALRGAEKIVVLSRDYGLSSKNVQKFHNKVVEIAPPNRFYSHPIGKVEHPRTTLICGFVGRFVEEKGIQHILEAAHDLREENITFVLAGDFENVAGGSIYPKLQKQFSELENVTVLGKLSEKELVDFYRKIDVLLLPSTNRFEAFGMVQIEAMSFGAIPIASNLPGVRDTIIKTGIGILCEPGSTESLTQSIRSLKVETNTRDRLKARDAVLESFDNNKFRKSYVELIERLSPGDRT
jgi:glycosyltransferase involved in cell wall biosynthesis